MSRRPSSRRPSPPACHPRRPTATSPAAASCSPQPPPDRDGVPPRRGGRRGRGGPPRPGGGRARRITREAEPQPRATLRPSLEAEGAGPDELLLRQGRAIGWREALEPLREQMSPDEVHRLALATPCACGIEALVWLTDVAGLARDDAAGLMCWSALPLLRGATDGAPAVGAA